MNPRRQGVCLAGKIACYCRRKMCYTGMMSCFHPIIPRCLAGIFLLAMMAAGGFAASAVGPQFPGVFRQTDLDGGGWLTGFASHASGRLYARTDVGGVYRSEDHGASWHFLSGDMTSPAGHFVQGLLAGESSPDLVFQAVGTSYTSTDSSRGIWKSSNAGQNWSQVLGGVNFSGNDDLRWQGECLASTPGSGDQEIFAITRKSGLWRSTGGGAAGTWSKQGGSVFDGLIGQVVHMDAAFPADIFVGGVNDGGASAMFRGIRGGNGSITWSTMSITASTTSVTRLARLPDGRMFAAVQEGSANRFYRSDASVSSWTNITASVLGSEGANGPVGMCHVLRDGSTVVLGWIGGPTRKSTNGGANWTTVPLAITGDRPAAMLAGDTSPGWSRGSLHQDPLDPDRWYLPNGFGPFVSHDGGATVRYMTRGIGQVVAWKPSWHPHDPNRVYLPVADLIGFVAIDGSATGLAPRNPRRSLPVINGNVGMTYACKALVGPVTGQASPKVYFVGGSYFGPNAGRASILTTSTDGTSWSLVHVAGVTGTGLPAGSEIVSGCIAPDNAEEILVAVNDTSNTNSGIFRSTNGGLAFTKSTGIPVGGNWGTEFSRFVFMEADTVDPARRFAWLNGVGFLVSMDRGVTWTNAGHASTGTAAAKLYSWNTWGSFARDKATGTLWFGGMIGHLGLAYSTNNGSNWTYLDTPFSNTGFEEIRALDAHAGQVLVCGRRFGDTRVKIYISDNNGQLWRECSKAGFRFPSTSEVALNPHQRGAFWIATNGRSYARFSPGDFAAWQQDHFHALDLNEPGISAADADPDGDGQDNAMEFATGLAPGDPASRFTQSAGLTGADPTRRMRMQIGPCLPGRDYTVETNDHPAANENWQALVDISEQSIGDQRIITDLAPLQERKFYRVRIERQ